MSKDFEKEYIKLAESEIPDLWNRIEAGLTEKSTHTAEFAPEQGNKITHNIEWIRRYAGLAAAVLCIALIVPAWMLFHPTAGKSSSADTSAPEAAEAEMAAEMTEEMAAGMAAEVTGEMAAAEAYDEMASEEVVKESAEAPAISSVSADTDNQKRQFSAVKDEASVEAKVESESELKEELEAAPEGESETGGSILRNVVVQVLSVQNDVYKEDGSTSGGVVYTVTVCEEYSGILAKGEELEVYQTSELLGEMKAGQKYEIDILCDSEKEYPYIIDRIN